MENVEENADAKERANTLRGRCYSWDLFVFVVPETLPLKIRA